MSSTPEADREARTTGPGRAATSDAELDWYAAGVAAGYQLGYAAAEADMAAAWTPVAERVQASAGQASRQQLLAARGEYPTPGGGYRTRPRPGDYPGGPTPWTADCAAACAPPQGPHA